MASTVYVRLGETPEQQVSWLSRGDVSTPASRSEPLRQLVEKGSQGARWVVLAPAVPMVTLEAQVPPLTGQRLRQALPYALEEQFAGDVEALHIAHGKRNGDGTMPVVALNQEQMEQWQQLFASMDFHPQQLRNEALSLPLQEGEWSLLLEQDEALLRTGLNTAYSFPLEQLSVLLGLAWKQRGSETIEALHVYDARVDTESLESAISQVVDTRIEYETIKDPLTLLVQGAEAGTAINLLQGEYSQREQLGKLWRPWRLSAALLVAWLALQGITAIWQYFSLSSQDAWLYAEVERIYRETFPEAKNVVNPRLQMERKLAELKGEGGSDEFAMLLSGSGPVLAGMEGVKLRSLRYKPGELELELELKGLPVLDQIKSGLQEKKLVVDVRSATTRDDKVESRIVIKGSGA